MTHTLLLWGGFILLILVLLAFDMGLLSRKSREIGFREALARVGAWIALAMAFNVGVYFRLGHQKGLEFFAGYLLEQSLSVDNMFVFLLIFNYFKVAHAHQHKVLVWGILGALVLRAVFILTGVALIQRFHWIIYGFGAFLVYTGYSLLGKENEEVHPEKSLALRIFRRFVPLTAYFEGDRFFVVSGGYLTATPLFVVLLLIETTDVLFALDSIPAVIAVSHDPFIVFTSNVFAILGLRSLYFALAGLMRLFHRLNYGLAAILMFIGAKMMTEDILAKYDRHIPTSMALGFIALCLTLSIAASLIWPEEKEADEASAED